MTDIVRELIAGRLRDPDSGEWLRVPVKSVIIEKSFAGSESTFVKALDLEPPFAVITDDNTYEALGHRIERALGDVIPIRLGVRPYPDDKTAELVMQAGVKAGSYIAVGSGTINDLAKHAAARQNKRCAVFATAPSMNGYTSVNVAITVAGHKKSLPAVAPEGVFMELDVLAKAPKRLIRAGFGDAICRTTAQCDWYMAHRLRGTPYRKLPFTLFADLEEAMIAEPAALISGDVAAIERLAQVLLLSGFGMTICGNSSPASQGEHLISHFIEMSHPPDWAVPLHGEQIAVTTLVMARLQESLIKGPAPVLKASKITRTDLLKRFGEATGADCWKELEPKLLNRQKAEEFSARIAAIWTKLAAEIAGMMRPAATLEHALGAIGAPLTYRDIDLTAPVFSRAVQHAREIRNRYTFLDLAADSAALVPERFIG